MPLIDKNLLDRIEKYLSKVESKGLKGISATDDEIFHAEKILNVKFNDSYVQFIKKFGGAWSGFDIHAFRNGSSLGKGTVIDLTNDFRLGAGEDIPVELKDAYVISTDGSGNPIFMNTQGNIFIFLHDSWDVELMYSSFDEFLMIVFPEVGGYFV